MSLDFEFFKKRHDRIEEKRKLGWIWLDLVLKERGLTEQDLLKVGILEPKIMLSTVDLSKYQLSARGKKFISVDRRFDILWVRKATQQALLDLLEQARADKSSARLR